MNNQQIDFKGAKIRLVFELSTETMRKEKCRSFSLIGTNVKILNGIYSSYSNNNLKVLHIHVGFMPEIEACLRFIN